MELRRYLLFLLMSFAFMMFWMQVVAPQFLPKKPAAAKQADDKDPQDAAKAVADADDKQAGADDKQGDAAPDDGDKNAAVDPEDPKENDPPEAPVVEFNEADQQTVTLGSLDAESGYFMEVILDSRGGSIASVRLNHPRFRELADREQPVQLIGDSRSDFRTLSTSVGAMDTALKQEGTSLDQVNWNVQSTVADADDGKIKNGATFSFRYGDLEVRKTFRIESVKNENGAASGLWDSASSGYQIHFEQTLLNHATKPVELDYSLQGPVGIRLENREHTRKYRDVKVGLYSTEDSDETRIETVYAKALADSVRESKEEGLSLTEANAKLDSFETAFKYVAVDVQFFAAVLAMEDDRDAKLRIDDPVLSVAQPMVTQANSTNLNYSDVSFRVGTKTLRLPPAKDGKPGELKHAFGFYAGPKREILLTPQPFAAEALMDYGWFGFIARRMVALLRFLNRMGIPYAIAIIMMTMMVRGVMFPFSRKQAQGAKKMKELQPELTALKAKYGNDKEKMARAQMELFRKHNYNPFAGCLPVVFQMPIFIGLYTALNAAVDLRLQRFLWADNMAAPDQLFRMPFSLPFLGQDFNVLPLVTVVLFSVQQKMFMPPPTDEQQALQQKMMSYMTLVFGFLFWHVPAGLCVYFIASSIWGLCERLALDIGKKDDGLAGDVAADESPDPAPAAQKKQNKKQNSRNQNSRNQGSPPKDDADLGFFGRMAKKLQEAAEEAQQQAQASKRDQDRGGGGRGGKGKKKKKRR